MSDMRNKDDRVAAFGELLDTHGGDPARWPPDRRAEAERLIATSPEARRLVGEAAALDRVLAAAPAVGASQPLELSKRIIEAVRASQRGGKRGGAGSAMAPVRWLGWASAGVLAASFAFGIVLGLSETGAPYVADVAVATGLSDTTASLSDLLIGDVAGEGEVL